MSKSDSLHTLILSLSKGEKSYFKKHLTGTGDKNDKIYIQLFDAIATQKEYNEVAFKKKYAGKTFIKQFAYSKNYLFNLIVKSLKLHHLEEDVDSVIFNLISESNLLLKKALYKEASKRLLKALKLAEKYEKFSLSMKIYLLMHRYIIMRSAFVEDGKPQWICEQLKKVTAQVNELTDYRKLSYESWSIYYSEQSFNQKEQQIKAIINSPLLSDETKQLSLRAKIIYHNIRGLIYQWFYKDKQKTYIENKKNIQLMDAHPDFANQEKMLHLSALNNFLLESETSKNEAEFEKYINILSGLSVKYTNEKISIFEKEVMLRLGYYVKTLRIKEGLAYLKEKETGIENQEELMNTDFLLSIYDSISIIYFCAGQYAKSVYYIHKTIYNKESQRWDIKCFAHLLYLFIQFEKGDIDHLEYQLKFAEKFIQQHKGLKEYERYVISFFKNYLQFNDKKHTQGLLKKLITELEKELAENHSTQMMYDYFNVIEWAKAKLNNTTYLQQMQV